MRPGRPVPVYLRVSALVAVFLSPPLFVWDTLGGRSVVLYPVGIATPYWMSALVLQACSSYVAAPYVVRLMRPKSSATAGKPIMSLVYLLVAGSVIEYVPYGLALLWQAHPFAAPGRFVAGTLVIWAIGIPAVFPWVRRLFLPS